MNKERHIALNTFSCAAQLLKYLGKSAGVFPFGIYSDWKHLLPEIYHEYYSETEILNEIDHSFKEKWTEEKVVQLITETSDKPSLAQLIYLYFELLKKSDHLIALNKLEDTYQNFCSENNLYLVDKSKIEEKVEEWVEKKEKGSFRPVISIRVTLWLVFLDFILRFTVLNLSNAEAVLLKGSSIEMEFANIGILIISHLFVVPAIVGLTGFTYQKLAKRRTNYTLSKLDLSHIKITPKISAWDYFIVGVMSMMGVGIGTLTEFFDDAPVAILFFVTGLLVTYYLLILRFFSLPVPSSVKIYHKLKERDQIEVDDNLSSDENDIEIVNLEVRLRSLTEKMNAFVIEAALFGALAFSGFIQVIAAEIFELSAFSEFNGEMIELSRGIVSGDSTNIAAHFNKLLHRNTLLSLLCYESLFCSICFLSVIASRMRFSDLTDKLDKALALSKNFNHKEEGLILYKGQEKNSEGVKHYNQLIKLNLQNGLKDYNKIKPVLEYMRFFRTLGIGTFFIIIITGGLFISPVVSILFTVIFVVSMVYFKFPIIKAFFLVLKTKIQETRASNERKISWIFIGLLIIITIYRTYYLPYSGYLLLVVSSLVVLHQLSLLIEGKTLSFTNKIFTRFFRFGVVFMFLGLGFKSAHWPGASLLLIVGTLFICLFFAFHPLTAEKKIHLRILAIGFSIALLGMLFKLQHWPGATMMKNIGLVSIGIASILALYKQSYKTYPDFYKWFIGIAITVGFSTILFKGAGYRVIASLNADMEDIKKFNHYSNFMHQMGGAIDSTRKADVLLDFENNPRLKKGYKSVMEGEFSWLQKESVLGHYAVYWLIPYSDVNKMDTNVKFSKNQLNQMINYLNNIKDNCLRENPEYMKYHSLELNQVLYEINYAKSLKFFQLNQLDSAKKCVDKLVRSVANGEQQRYYQNHDTLKSLIDKKLLLIETSIDTTSFQSTQPQN